MSILLTRCAYDINISLPQDLSFLVVNGENKAYISCKSKYGEHIFNFKEKEYRWINGNEEMIYTSIFGETIDGEGIPLKHIVSPKSTIGFESGGMIEPATYTVFEILFNVEDEESSEEKLTYYHDLALKMLKIFIEKYRYVTQDNTLTIPNEDDFLMIEHLESVDTSALTSEYGAAFKPVSVKYNYNSLLKKRVKKYPIERTLLNKFATQLENGKSLDLYIMLLMEAKEHAQIFNNYDISIVKSETAFEVYIQQLLINLCETRNISMLKVGNKNKDFKEAIFNGNIRETLIKKYLKDLTNLSIAGTKEYNDWFSNCFDIRNQIVHRGSGTFLTEEDARKAFESVNTLIGYIDNKLSGIND